MPHTPTLPPSHLAPDRPDLDQAIPPRTWRQRLQWPAISLVILLLLAATTFFVHDALCFEETDDAYITGHTHLVSSRLAGDVTSVRVQDNEKVHAGEVLVTLDDSEYQAIVLAAKANLAKAQDDFERKEPLAAAHAISPEDVSASRDTRDSNLAQLTLAQLQVAYATITAPADGRVGRKSVEVGNRVTAGQTLLAIIEPDVWVVANFKETQLAKMRVGQPVVLTVDALPNRTFTGRVQSFSPGSGNEFALLPADNSTGNFTKIVQRIPVKIVFDKSALQDAHELLRAGESVEVKVDVTQQNGLPVPRAP